MRTFLDWYATLAIWPEVDVLPLYLPHSPKWAVLTVRDIDTATGSPRMRDSLLSFERQAKAHYDHLVASDRAAVSRSPRIQPMRGPLLFLNPDPEGEWIDAVMRVDSVYGIDLAVRDLVGYRWYAGRPTETGMVKLPASMVSAIQAEYDSLVRALPLAKRRWLKNWTVSVLPPPDVTGKHAVLWMQSEHDNSGTNTGHVFISPALARAALFHGLVIEQWYLLHNLRILADSGGFSIDRPDFYTENELPSLLAGARRQVGQFRAAMRFALAHEMAHIYLGEGAILPGEARADCWAIAELTASRDSLELGVFVDLLVAAHAEGVDRSLWGIESPSDADSIPERLRLIGQWSAALRTRMPESACPP